LGGEATAAQLRLKIHPQQQVVKARVVDLQLAGITHHPGLKPLDDFRGSTLA